MRIIPVTSESSVALLLHPHRPLILSDNIHARSFALLNHRLPSSQPLAYIIAQLRLAFLEARTHLHYHLCHHILLCIFILVSLFLFRLL